jgi:hypothetical protein
MNALYQFVWRDGTREDAIIGWMMIGLMIGCIGVGSWLWLEWYGRRVARWRREARARDLAAALEPQAIAEAVTDAAREAAWKAKAEETRAWKTVNNG